MKQTLNSLSSLRLPLITVLAGSAALVIAACDTPSFGTKLDSRQIAEIGAESAVQIENQYPAAPDSAPGTASFRTISTAIASHATGLPEAVKLQFTEIDTPDEIAISLPDGHVFVSDGLLVKIADDPSEIACVLAHEAGHVAQGHDVQNLTAALGESAAQDLLAEGKYQEIANTELELCRLSYTKEQEYEADRYAVRLAEASGYDAAALPKFLNLIGSEPRSQYQVYWDQSHPLSKTRAGRIEQYIRSIRH